MNTVFYHEGFLLFGKQHPVYHHRISDGYLFYCFVEKLRVFHLDFLQAEPTGRVGYDQEALEVGIPDVVLPDVDGVLSHRAV